MMFVEIDLCTSDIPVKPTKAPKPPPPKNR